MPKYRYRAANAKGRTVRGSMVAAGETELYEKLKTQGQYLISASEVLEKGRYRPLKVQALADFCRELGTLLGTGVSLVRALGMIAQNESVKPAERAVYEELLRMIRQGMALSDAMDSMGRVFPAMMINMFRAAESSGSMDKTAAQLSVQYTKQHRLNGKIKSSTAYPKFLMCMIVGVVAVLVGFVLPQFDSLFSMMEELPLPTRILYGITGFVSSYWYLVIIGAVLGVLAIRWFCGIPSIRIQLDRFQLHMILLGKLWKVVYTARFARALSSLYSAGIAIVTALQIAKNSIGNTYIEKQFEEVIAALRGGANLSDALEPVDGFVKKLVFSVRVGEETGQLDIMLRSTAEDLEYESEMAINKMVTYLEPAMIVVMALVVGFIMVAVMMPIFASYNVLGG